MRQIILSSVVCQTVHNFTLLSHKRQDIREKIIEYKIVFWFSLQVLSEIFFILRRTETDMIISVYWSYDHITLSSSQNIYWSSCNIPAIFVTF